MSGMTLNYHLFGSGTESNPAGLDAENHVACGVHLGEIEPPV